MVALVVSVVACAVAIFSAVISRRALRRACATGFHRLEGRSCACGRKRVDRFEAEGVWVGDELGVIVSRQGLDCTIKLKSGGTVTRNYFEIERDRIMRGLP